MSASLYVVLFIFFAALILAVILIAQYKKNSHTVLYKEGVHHENEGNYKLALQNFEDALMEIRKLKVDHKFGNKIEERIKMLRTLVDYEKSFQAGRPV
ncbi:MAG TPA: hypothetical protein VKT28_01585 [Puia sp.]|nr:hypothetical protein [Puia sp.]